MKFQVSLLKNNKRRLITYLILIVLFCFFVTSIPVSAGLFGEKIKKISDSELKEVVKVELNLSKDPSFYSYTDSILKEALDKEINSQEIPGLTFGSFILNALYEEKLVEMCYPNFDDKESSLFFSKLADNLSNWQENFASKTTKLALQGVIEAYLKMPKLGMGTSTLFLAIDLVQINVAMAKLAKVIARKALFYYLTARYNGDSHDMAWGEGIPPLYDTWQTESFFQSLWNKYGEAILSDNLARFKEEQHEILRELILQALNQPPNLPTNMIQFKSDGKAILKIGKVTTEKTVILKAKVSDPDGNKARLQIELRRLDEYEGKFDEEKGGLQQSDLFENNSEVMIPIYGLADGDYHWRARAINEYGLSSKWVSFGGNPNSAIDFSVGQEVIAPIITSTLKITSDSPYYVEDTINAEFAITNKDSLPITFSVLTVGGRDPDDQVADFTHRQNITLEPSESYNYQGILTLNKVGDYHFFCAYQTPDGNWNTNIDLGPELTDKDRTEDITVGQAVVVQDKLPQSPQISISEEEWDFGKIKENERPVHLFTIKNTGREELIISRVRASCGCTATMLSSDHILPGKSVELKVTFNPTGYNGLVKKDIYIESNDPQLPKTKIVVIAEVQAVVVPVITANFKITPVYPYYMADTINAEFSITNEGSIPITFIVLTLGVRDPDDRAADFTHRQNITLKPSESYDYRGTLTLNKVGYYYFFCFYKITDNASVTHWWPITARETLREMIEVNLYFSDSQAMYLVSEKRKIPQTTSLAKQVVIELIKGPTSSSLYPTIPQGTSINEVYIAGDIAYIDLSEEVFKNHPGGIGGELMTVYSIVNSLTEISPIKGVQILVEGNERNGLVGHVDISMPLLRDEDWIKP